MSWRCSNEHLEKNIRGVQMTPSNNFFRWCFVIMLLATLFMGYIIIAKGIFYGIPLVFLGIATSFYGLTLCDRRAKLEDQLKALNEDFRQNMRSAVSTFLLGGGV